MIRPEARATLLSPVRVSPGFGRGDERNVGGGGRDDPSPYGQQLSRHFDGTGEVAANTRQGCNEHVAEAVAVQLAGGLEAVVHQLLHDVLRVREGHQAVTYVPRRLYAQLAAKPS